KIAFGPWMFTAFTWLAKLRRLRGTILDPFGRTDERRFERQLIADYEADIALILERGRNDPQVARDLAAWPEKVRGFGVVKMTNARSALDQRATLRERLMT
ncbi:MAG: DUF6537 domain-containing protein, partial [Actinomycetota bacterium]